MNAFTVLRERRNVGLWKRTFQPYLFYHFNLRRLLVHASQVDFYSPPVQQNSLADLLNPEVDDSSQL